MKKLLPLTILLLSFWTCIGQTLFVSTTGNDENAGTKALPLKTLTRAITLALGHKNADVNIEIFSGNYPIGQTINIYAKDYKLRSLTIRAYGNERVILSGSQDIKPDWKASKEGALFSKMDPGESFDQLFMDGKLLHMARYPDFDSTAKVFNGTAPDAISEERVAKWANPEGGYIHTLHQSEWGDFHYLIHGKDQHGKLVYEGGWQNNRPAKMHAKYRYVENIFEELDAPGEWFYDNKNKILYLIPPTGSDPSKVQFSVSRLTDLIHIRGSVAAPVKNVTIQGIDFVKTSRSFMQVKEPLLRSDWRIFRSGAILLDGTENINIRDCNFYNLGGSAVFVSNYNMATKIINNHIYNIGANAIAFVGNAAAVRSPSFHYSEFVPFDKTDSTPGPKGRDFPQDCEASGNLIHNIGMIEKQSAGVEIAMSSKILVSHNSIYKVPRAGINISEGTWGGHIIEFNDVFDTVLETGDHGAFNSWGRDRYWRPNRNTIDSIVAAKPGIELLDVINPITIRNNRFRCDHGWDIDLDDGSSNYLIYNNVCLSGGLKLREGYLRKVYNNIIINNTFHPHVWLKNSRDIFKNNVVTSAYAPILMKNWGQEIDYNFFLSEQALSETRKLNTDRNSSWEKPMFRNANIGDYHLNAGSIAVKGGFRNFEMDNFGVIKPSLKKIARKPEITALAATFNKTEGVSAGVPFLGGELADVNGLGDRSAYGLPDENGAIVVTVGTNSLLLKSGLMPRDVIRAANGKTIRKVQDLLAVYESDKEKTSIQIEIMRNQKTEEIRLRIK